MAMKKKLDPSIQDLIEVSVKRGHRSFFVLVGDHGKDQVENLHRILCNARVKARPSVLWCYKKELGFSSHKQKRMKELKKEEKRGLRDPDRDDPFELFITTTNIRWTYYKDTDKILGQTFGACVLQDFEAVTPNVLARTIETVEGGGMVILLLNTVKSLKQLYSLSMDVHTKFRTSSHDHVVPRFNERFILSLSQCKSCMALDDELNVLPLQSADEESGGSHAASSLELSETKDDLKQLKSSLEDTPIIGDLVSATKTSDQAQVLVSFFDVISVEQQQSFSKPVISLTAARGRGKSASIGLCIAGAVGYGYSNIYITAPSKENLFTTFSILIDGLKAMKYVEHTDYEIIYDGYTGGGNSGDGKRHLKIPSRINIFKKHKQTIQYVEPNNALSSLAGADILAIDEAASIPLPVVKKLLGHCTTILSTTVHGYEGTGRSLSLKLLDQLRSQREADHSKGFKFSGSGEKVQKSSKKSDKVKHEERWAEAARHNSSGRKTLHELTLTTPIRYGVGDPVEKWLNTFLCLDLSTTNTRLVSSVPAPKDCELFAVNRDALFSHHSLSETLLQRIWSIYSTAHYKNSPNDLQVLSDAPAHRLYILMGPQKDHSGGGIPDILCVVQVAFEGKISQKIVHSELARGSTPSGDLIPWTLSQQYNDSEFPRLSGARVVRIATNPDAQGMGYGSRALELLSEFFSGESSGLEAEGEIVGESESGSLLVPLRDKRAERLHWLGSSFGLTNGLHKFWKRRKYEVCYVRQTENDVTGEHSTIVIKELSTKGMKDAPHAGWSKAYKLDYRRRLLSMLGYTFSKLDLALALSIVDPDKEFAAAPKAIEDGDGDTGGFREVYGSSPLGSQELLSAYLTHYDMKRLELYSRNMVDYHLIMDTLPVIARLFFLGRLSECRLSALQVSILLAVGLQHRTMDDVCAEMQLPINQILAFFNKAIRKISIALRKIVESEMVQNIEGAKKKTSGDVSSPRGASDGASASGGSESVRVLTKMDIPEASEEVKASRVMADYGREKSNDSSKGKDKKKKKNKKSKDSTGDGEFEARKKQKV